jgi:hypothetical protein
MLLKSAKADLKEILKIYFEKALVDTDSKCIFAHTIAVTKVTKLY